VWHICYTILRSLTLGTLAGWAFGNGIIWLINRIKLDTDGLYPVLAIAMTILTFSTTDIIGGNGFLAVYISAVIMGNHRFVHKKSLMRFNDGIAWLMQVVMILMLGLLVTPSQIIPVIGIGLLISFFMIIVARPAVIFILMAFSKFTVNDKIFISWGGLRGAVPIVFAAYALVAGVPHADTIFNIVFFISVTSVLIQGTSLTYMANKLGLSLPQSDAGAHPLDYELSDSFRSELVDVKVEKDSVYDGGKIVELNIPHSVMVILIYRQGKYFAPNGSTKIAEGDTLTLMSESKQDIENVKTMCRKTLE
ncbi:MAG: cation:proton antiporter, partial [Flavobacteriales bacterium]|nr:cation:proton antiporter [Flavobacteriales bacterium]